MNEPLVNHALPNASILLLSGFLGAGKTTLLKRIIAWEADLADTVVLVNEFGDIGVDGSLLKDSGSDIVELTSGCICCTLSADLKRSLMNIWERFKPRRIFIESSGLADPKSLTSILNQTELLRRMNLQKIITVLDADFWDAREAFGPLFYNQLEMAHLILLNKIDLLAKSKIPLMLKEIHEVIPDAQVIPTIHCAVDPETLWVDPKSRTFDIKPIQFYLPSSTEANSNKLNNNDAEFDHDAPGGKKHHNGFVDTANYVTFSYQNLEIIDETRFKQFLKHLPWEMFRIKGPVRFADRVVMLNYVGGKGEWSPWDGELKTQLAFIGWDVDGNQILSQLKRCVIKAD
jgi:G3E family GTPase